MSTALNYILINSLNIKISLWLHVLSCSHIFQLTAFVVISEHIYSK